MRHTHSLVDFDTIIIAKYIKNVNFLKIIRFFCSDDSDLNNSEESSKYSI